MSSDGGASENPAELFALLDSDNRVTIEQTKALIHENLYTSRDPTLLNALIEFYLETRSVTTLQILANLHEGRAHQLFERLNEHLKQSSTRMDTLILLGHIVRRQPSWLHKIVSTNLFETMIKLLKGDTDVLILVSGLMIVSTLLPLVPTSVGGKLEDLFDIFVRVSSFGAFKPGNTPAVHLLHLNVSVYIFIHRLYAMFPNNMLEYLRNKFGGKSMSRSLIFQQVIKPMMEQVRLHPCLVTETSVSEVGKTRWRAKEPHDIVIECEKLSLESLDDGAFNIWASRQSLLDLNNVDKSSHDANAHVFSSSRLKERRMSDSATQTGKSLQFGDSGVESAGAVISAEDLTSAWSPALSCGLCTPPSSQMSRSASHLELSKSMTFDQSLCSTPAKIQTPGESPTPSLAGDISCSIVSPKEKIVLLDRDFGGGIEVVTEPARTASSDNNLHNDLIYALLQHTKEANSSSSADQRTSTPRVSLITTAATEVGCDAAGDDNHKSDLIVEEVKDTKAMETIGCSYEFQGQQLMVETGGLKKGHFCSTLGCCDMEQLIGHPVSERCTSGKVPREMLHEETAGHHKTETFSLPSIVKTGKNLNNKAFDEPLPDSSLLRADSKHTEPSSVDCKDQTNQFENKSTENSFDDAYKSFLEAGIMPNSNTFHVSSWPWKSSHDTSGLEDNGTSGKVNPKTSPLDVLDTFIKLGAGIHMDEIARLPLVSLPGIDWTHYGGNPPVDEIDILRRQVQLLHQQLLYERYKCEQHALRNRRLISKTFKAIQYKEELQATKDHLKLQEEKMKELSDALNKESETNRKLKELTSSWDNQQQTQIRNLFDENAQLQRYKEQAEEKLKTRKEEFDVQQEVIQQTKATLFTLESEVKKLKEQMSEKETLISQVDTISKELLLMSEVNQQQKEQIKKLSTSESQIPEATIQLLSISEELSLVQQVVWKQRAEIDAQASKLSDSEVLLSRKDMEIKELKKFAENVKGTYIAKLKALEDKYAAQKKVNRTLESHVLSLQAVLDNKNRISTRTKDTAISQTERQGMKSPTCGDLGEDSPKTYKEL